ncbi:hypothetical protein Tco_0599826 [Tanacetum coccineum]
MLKQTLEVDGHHHHVKAKLNLELSRGAPLYLGKQLKNVHVVGNLLYFSNMQCNLIQRAKVLRMMKANNEVHVEQIQCPRDISRRIQSICDDDEDDSISLRDIYARYSTSKSITPDLPTVEPEDSLIMGDKHLSTISEKESDEIQSKSSVGEPLSIIPSESEDFSDNESECDVPVFDDFTTFSNPLFDSDDDFSSNDDESFSDEDVPNENFKFYSNPIFDEEIISSKIKPHHFNAESDLIESLLNRDILTDEILREKLINVNLLIDKIEALNLIPSIPFVLEYPSTSPIPVVDNDFLIEEVDTFLVLEDSKPPGIESDFDSKGDIIFSNDLLHDDLIPEYERFTFDIEPDAPVINNFDELNEDECFDPGGGKIDVSQNIEDDDSFAFVIRTFFSYRTYPVDSPLLLFTGSEDTIFDPGIST